MLSDFLKLVVRGVVNDIELAYFVEKIIWSLKQNVSGNKICTQWHIVCFIRKL